MVATHGRHRAADVENCVRRVATPRRARVASSPPARKRSIDKLPASWLLDGNGIRARFPWRLAYHTTHVPPTTTGAKRAGVMTSREARMLALAGREAIMASRPQTITPITGSHAMAAEIEYRPSVPTRTCPGFRGRTQPTANIVQTRLCVRCQSRASTFKKIFSFFEKNDKSEIDSFTIIVRHNPPIFFRQKLVIFRHYVTQ